MPKINYNNKDAKVSRSSQQIEEISKKNINNKPLNKLNKQKTQQKPR